MKLIESSELSHGRRFNIVQFRVRDSYDIEILTTQPVLCFFFFVGCSGLMESTSSPIVASVLVPVKPTSDATPNKYTDVPSM